MLLVSHPFLLNHAQVGHPESPSRLQAIFQVLDPQILYPYRLATRKELHLIHDPNYTDRILSYQDQIIALDAETFLVKDSVHCALLACGLGIQMIQNTITQNEPGFLLTRPPGHHATSSQAMGFCIFNTIALAAQWALNQGLKRILILDWDVHHGNGTQAIFYHSPEVLFIDLHQDGLYPPHSGRSEEQGEGAGKGYTLNIPLAAHSGDSIYLDIFDRIISPQVQSFAPECILVSAGFDAHESDPLGAMDLTTYGYQELTRKIQKLAQTFCPGRLLFFLEGGYQPEALAQNVLACAQVLSS
jgi:acetoin utilization deacetylase AcuC-like enzyme